MPVKYQDDFDPKNLIATVGEGGRFVTFSKEQPIFSQREAADVIFYIQKGKIRLSIMSKSGKDAILGILREGQFFGEGALAGQRRRRGSAIALTDCELLSIDNKAMMLALRRERRFADMFVAYLLARNIRYEEDLVDQLFNSSEKRLARILLLLAHFGKENPRENRTPQNQSRNPCRDGGHNSPTSQFFHEQIQKVGHG